jgi:hypothetical protein
MSECRRNGVLASEQQIPITRIHRISRTTGIAQDTGMTNFTPSMLLSITPPKSTAPLTKRSC